MYKLFWQTMSERHNIWKKRFLDKENAHLTEDLIMQKYKFTNVYRELDASSQFLIHNIIAKEKDFNNLIFKILIYKLYNRPNDVFLNIPHIDNFDKEKDYFFKSIKDIKGAKFHNAYSLYRNVKKEGYDNMLHMYEVASIKNIVDNLDSICTSLINGNITNLLNSLLKIKSIGNFLAHEYYQDFTYINNYSNFKIPIDGMMHTNVGPGSYRGVQLIYEKVKQNEVIKKYDLLLNEAKDNLNDFYYIKWDSTRYIKDNYNFNYSQIEHWLCEFSKYVRIMQNPDRHHKKFKCSYLHHHYKNC